MGREYKNLLKIWYWNFYSKYKFQIVGAKIANWIGHVNLVTNKDYGSMRTQIRFLSTKSKLSSYEILY